jgi:hypothetical protein
MHFVLLALGAIVAIAGGGMTIFGVANNGFDIGNTMISAGMTGLVGGLLVVALANVARELRAARQSEPRRPSPASASALPAEPASPARDTSAEKPSPAAAGAADLSQVLAEPPGEPTPAEPRVEPPPPAPRPGDPFAPARADPQRRAGARERSFDTVWASESAKPVPAGVRPPPEASRESESVPLRAPREAQAVSVLKSGVIEGMAYTLYSDGSIEADLPQGMARFPSIDALRRHLAGQG